MSLTGFNLARRRAQERAEAEALKNESEVKASNTSVSVEKTDSEVTAIPPVKRGRKKKFNENTESIVNNDSDSEKENTVE